MTPYSGSFSETTLWLDTDGNLITDASGEPILCATCPCEAEGSTEASACPDSLAACTQRTLTVTFPAPYAAWSFTTTLAENGNSLQGTYSDADHWYIVTAVLACGMVAGMPCWFLSLGGIVKRDGNLGNWLANPGDAKGCGQACPPAGSYNLAPTTMPPDTDPFTVTASLI